MNVVFLTSPKRKIWGNIWGMYGEILSEQNMSVVFSHLSQKLIKLRFRHEDANIVKSPSQVILVNCAVLEN